MTCYRAGLVLVVGLGLVRCGGSGEAVVGDTSAPDVGDERAEEDSGRVPDGNALPDLEPLDWARGEASADPGRGFELADGAAENGVDPGEPGYPCQSGEECASGYCILTADGRRCTMECLAECPIGWQCASYKPALPDEVYICAPAAMNLCRPCRQNSDCLLNGAEMGDRCLAYGPEGSFCGAKCGPETACPPGYECLEATDVAGGTSWQCRLKAGECQCAQWFVDEAAATDCQAVNDLGTCQGERMCAAVGLTPCDAAIPAAEACNGEDDDCDGDADEGTSGGPCYKSNEFGTCPGVEDCTAGKLTCQAPEAAPETCDGQDNDCDGGTDETFTDTDKDGLADCLEADKDGDGVVDGKDNCPSDFNPAQTDSDLDGMGDVCDQDDDNDKVADPLDCAPADSAVYPGAAEACNGKDDDCDDMVDEGFPDSDSDALHDCIDDDDDNDGFADASDCKPQDGKVFPGALEICDGQDNDCDFDQDESFPDLDADGEADCIDLDVDGDGSPNGVDNCPKVSNGSQADADKDGLGDACDGDADGDGIPDALDNCLALFNPQQQDLDSDGAGDACDADLDGDAVANDKDNCKFTSNPDQADQDLDGGGDACDDDNDGDGTPDQWDCAPADPYINPEADEVCDGQDNNCSGVADEGFPDLDLDGLKDCTDLDDDNDGDPDATDCRPADPAVFNGAKELCNAKDDDCDGDEDEDTGMLACGKGPCFHTVAACQGGMLQVCNPFEGAKAEACDGLDNDCDGLVDDDLGWSTCGVGLCLHASQNCKDGKPNPCDPLLGALPEACDGQDNDCDAAIDESPAQGCEMFFKDADGDWHGTGDPKCLCSAAGFFKAAVGDDCDDLNAWAFPGATELCDGQDNDCDLEKDEPGATGCWWFFTDDDGDGYGSGAAACVCSSPGSDWSVLSGDCDEADSEVHPGALELCDEADNDCDDEIDESFELDSDPKNCGACGSICQPDNAFGKCLGGKCAVDSCKAGFDNCNGKDPDGCEVDSSQDPANCGGCGKVCNLPHATALCLLGTCKIDQCAQYYADTDGKAENGCEAVTYGQTADNPGVLCKDIKTVVPGAQDGIYWIDPDGPGGKGALQVFCEMTTEGGGWTFFMHINSDFGSALAPMAAPIGTYKPSREDDNTTYSTGFLDEIADSELMVTLDSADPAAANGTSKIVFFKYNPEAPGGFNSGPLPCVGGLQGFQYKTAIAGPWTNGIEGSCNDGHFFPRTPAGQNLTACHGGTLGNYWGAGMGGNETWNHDGWWYVR